MAVQFTAEGTGTHKTGIVVLNIDTDNVRTSLCMVANEAQDLLSTVQSALTNARTAQRRAHDAFLVRNRRTRLLKREE